MTENNKSAFDKIAKLKKLLTAYYILLGCTLTFAFLTLWLMYSSSGALKVVSSVTIFFAAGFLIFHLIIFSRYLKCPVCGNTFFQRVLYIPNECRECGEDLTKYK